MPPIPESPEAGQKMMSSKRKRRSRAELLEAMEQAEDQRLEIENRIRNLFWTVSGDYSLEIRPDVDTFLRSKSLALYDAIKQGAFVSHFDARALALYTMKKQVKGADHGLLTDLTQLCVDAAVYPIVSRERSGVRETGSGPFGICWKPGIFAVPWGRFARASSAAFWASGHGFGGDSPKRGDHRIAFFRS